MSDVVEAFATELRNIFPEDRVQVGLANVYLAISLLTLCENGCAMKMAKTRQAVDKYSRIITSVHRERDLLCDGEKYIFLIKRSIQLTLW